MDIENCKGNKVSAITNTLMLYGKIIFMPGDQMLTDISEVGLIIGLVKGLPGNINYPYNICI